MRFIADEIDQRHHRDDVPRGSWTDIEATIKQLDRMPRQVLIEVLVAEITLTDDMRLGVDWALKSGSFRFGQHQHSTPRAHGRYHSALVLAPARRRRLGASWPAAGLTAFASPADEFFAMLNALATENRVNIVSNPHVMTSENKKAVINVSTVRPDRHQPAAGRSPRQHHRRTTTTNPSTTTPSAAESDGRVPRRRRDPHRDAAHRRARHRRARRQAGGERRRRAGAADRLAVASTSARRRPRSCC